MDLNDLEQVALRAPGTANGDVEFAAQVTPTVVLELIARVRRAEATIASVASHTIGAIEAGGWVVTANQYAFQPLAMGNYQTVVNVRPVRAK